MNLPLGLSALLEIGIKKKEGAAEVAATKQDDIQEEYRNVLDSYKKCILKYSDKLDDYEKKAIDSQLSTVQTAMDLTYLKEIGDKMVETLSEIKDGPSSKTLTELEGLTASLVEANYKLEGLDKNVVNRLSEMLEELQKQSVFQNKQIQTELFTSIEGLTKSVKKGRALTGFLFFFNILSLSGIVFLILYILEIIPF